MVELNIAGSRAWAGTHFWLGLASFRHLIGGMLLLAGLFGPSPAAFAAQMAAPHPAVRQSGGSESAADTVTLALRYENGESVPRDYRRALWLYCQAARRGNPTALFNLGWMYLNGRGVARDEAMAVMWFRKAADRGIPQAANLLATLSRVSPASSGGCPTIYPAGMAAGTGTKMLRTAPPAIRAVIEDTSRLVGISSDLLQSVISVESGFNPRAVSPKLAAGLMQLMPGTAARFGVRDRFDPRENVRAGAMYLRLLIEMFSGDLTLALAAYNAGENAVLARGGFPPFAETVAYVAAVKRLCGCQ